MDQYGNQWKWQFGGIQLKQVEAKGSGTFNSTYLSKQCNCQYQQAIKVILDKPNMDDVIIIESDTIAFPIDSLGGDISVFNRRSKIQDSFHDQNYDIYPNPTADKLTIISDGSEPYNAEIYNINGASLSSKLRSVYQSVQQTDIYLDDLLDGVYFLKISSGHNTRFEKIVKY